MKIKTTIVLFISLFAIACENNKVQEINQMIEAFRDQNVGDKRESIFDIHARSENNYIVLSGETDNAGLKEDLLLAFQNFEFEDHIVVLPDSTVGNKTFGLINLSVANLRSLPNHSTELATQALLGTPVKILKKVNGWFLVQTPDKYISWVDEDGIAPVSKIQLLNWRNSERIIFTGDNNEVYKTEKLESPVSDISMGNILEKISETSNTFRVKFPDGRIGFTNKVNWIDFGKFKNNVKADTAFIKSLAIKLTGRPYLWGGTSARAMDCSGFVKTIYFMNGILLARDASLQTNHGQLIDTGENYNNLQTGDLLFFGQKGNNSLPEKVTHVALSLGSTEFIHASGRIKKNSFNRESEIYSEYREMSFVRARRIIRSENEPGIVLIKNHPWY